MTKWHFLFNKTSKKGSENVMAQQLNIIFCK